MPPSMYLQIAVPRPIDKVFTYLCPEDWIPQVACGKRVRVPFGRQKATGYIVGFQPLSGGLPEETFKEIDEILDPEPVLNKEILDLAAWMAAYYMTPLGMVLKTVLPASGIRGTRRRVQETAGGMTSKGSRAESTPFRLNGEQEDCLERIFVQFEQSPPPILLHGVTGSGKTEIYLRSVEYAANRGMGSIVLVPEISLTSQAVSRFERRFPGRIAIFHSGLSDGERHEAWMRVRRRDADVVVGTRSAVFAPFPRLGLIVVDEEHDASYKQEEGLRYNARDVAVYRGRESGAVVLLGSATPSLESFHHTTQGKYHRLILSHRIDHRPLPTVQIVDMRSPGRSADTTEAETEPMKGGDPDRAKAKGTLFSPVLKAAIRLRLDKGEQTLLFLNRRGYFPLLICEDCGDSPACPNCSSSLTYHHHANHLLCHACDYRIPFPESCLSCRGIRLKALGMGTERVESEVKRLFPDARVIRMDRDTTRKKQAHHRMLDQMHEKKADILIGTQMVSKGLDFPLVTLVGVLLADTGLYLPDFRAGERTFQLLTQVSGRAGRGDEPGEVVIQTYNPAHPSIRFAALHDYEGFSREELAFRKELSFPPYRRLARILLLGISLERVTQAAHEMAEILHGIPSPSIEVLGPAPAPIEKLRGKYRWQFILKYGSPRKGHQVLQKAAEEFKVKHPSSRGVRLEIDIDPQSLL